MLFFTAKRVEATTSTATETIPEGEGEGENPEAEATPESPAVSDEVKSASKEPEQDTKDIETVTAATTEVKAPDEQTADPKAPEASTPPVKELQTTAGGEPNESIGRSEEPSADNKNTTQSTGKIDGIANHQGTVTQSPEESEKLFPPAAQERLLGLLGAILPQDSKVTLTILM